MKTLFLWLTLFLNFFNLQKAYTQDTCEKKCSDLQTIVSDDFNKLKTNKYFIKNNIIISIKKKIAPKCFITCATFLGQENLTLYYDTEIDLSTLAGSTIKDIGNAMGLIQYQEERRNSIERRLIHCIEKIDQQKSLKENNKTISECIENQYKAEKVPSNFKKHSELLKKVKKNIQELDEKEKKDKKSGTKKFHDFEMEAANKEKNTIQSGNNAKKIQYLSKYGIITVDEKNKIINIAFSGMGDESSMVVIGLSGKINDESHDGAHRGFFKKYEHIKQELMDALKEIKKNIQQEKIEYTYKISGHSMGGVFATFIAREIAREFFQDNKEEIEKKISVITFGAPKAFSKDAADKYNCLLGKKTLCVYFKNDPIPPLLNLIDYHDVGIPFEVEQATDLSFISAHRAYFDFMSDFNNREGQIWTYAKNGTASFFAAQTKYKNNPFKSCDNQKK